MPIEQAEPHLYNTGMWDIAEITRQLKQRLTALYGDRLVSTYMYGSRARGDASADSDVDVLVVLKDEVNSGDEIARASGLVSDISLRNDCVISCMYMSQQRYMTGGGPFLRNIRREAIAL